MINGQSLTCQCFPSKITPSVRLFSVCPFPKDSWEWRAIGGLFAQNTKTRNPFLYTKWLIFFFCRIRVSRQKIFFVGLSITYAPGISTVVLLLKVLPTRAEEDKAATKDGSGGGPSQCSQVSGSPLR